ncbi:hypothetical protein [Ferruginibacter sp. SUN106]|uniref:hypothetical protein n=1 Tax=Ferruginibacter sp. SUN106 TaxID=2978348 RepID=UPI003D36DCB8
MRKLFYTLIFLFFANLTRAQYTICDCCTYYSLQYEEDFEHIFDPALIKKNNIKQLTIYTTSKQLPANAKDTLYKIVDKEYREMILTFNANGFVDSKIFFNRLGQFHSINEFVRDNNNKILSRTFHYLDSSGKKDETFSVDRWVYKYADNNLQQIKKLGSKFAEQPDNKSDYTNFEYDSKGRVIKETRQLYYDFTASSFYQTSTTYNDSTHTSVAITKDKTKLFSTVNTRYSLNNQQPLNIKFIDGRNNKLLEEKIYTYSTNGQLLKFEVKNSGMGTECPDGGNLTDEYIYSGLNLISKIRHHYNNTICELRFDYR